MADWTEPSLAPLRDVYEGWRSVQFHHVHPAWWKDDASFVWFDYRLGRCRVADGGSGSRTDLFRLEDLARRIGIDTGMRLSLEACDSDGRIVVAASGRRWRADPELADVEELFSPAHTAQKTLAALDGPGWSAPITSTNAAARISLTEVVIATGDGDLRQFQPAAGHRWEPRGARWLSESSFAVRHLDDRGVGGYPTIRALRHPPQVEWTPPYRLPGMPTPHGSWVVLDVRDGHVEDLDIDGTTISPVSDNAVLVLTRDAPAEPTGSIIRLTRIDRTTKQHTILVEEPGGVAVVGWERRVAMADAIEQRTQEGALWLSEATGLCQVYEIDLATGARRQLTDGPGPVDRVVAVDAEDRVWSVGRFDDTRPYDRHVAVTERAGTRTSRVSAEPGVHDPIVSPSGRTWIDYHSSPNRPPRTSFHPASGAPVVLSKADVGRTLDPGFPRRTEFQVMAADGTTPLFGTMFTPTGLDRSARYPVVVSIYAGPYTSAIRNAYRPLSWALDAQALAALDFVTVILDCRGTAGRDATFSNFAWKRIGAFEIPDHVTALEQLSASRPWMDLTRVGIVGGSVGGWHAIRALEDAPDLFRAAVAIAPITDPMLQLGGDFYLGPPDDNPAIYQQASVLGKADRIIGDLLLVHGTADTNAPIEGTYRLITELHAAGRFPELLILPDEEHEPTLLSITVRERAASFLLRHLQGGESDE